MKMYLLERLFWGKFGRCFRRMERVLGKSNSRYEKDGR